MSTLTAQSERYKLIDHDIVMHQPAGQYVLRVRDMPSEERPREKLVTHGVGSLTLAELLAIVWGTGTRSEDVLAMAQRTFKEYGSAAIGNELNAERLAESANIPLGKASQVIAAFELGRRFYGTSRMGRPVQVRNAKQAYQYLKEMGSNQKEQLRGLYLNSRYQVVHDEVISVGSLTSNIVHPREVFQPAIERGAVAIIIAHNHPSGRLEPTLADIQVTEQLVSAGTVMGIELLDHLVITASSYTSVMECLAP